METCPAVVEVTTTARRVVRRNPGLRVRRRTAVSVHPSLLPSRQRLEDALLDCLDGGQAVRSFWLNENERTA